MGAPAARAGPALRASHVAVATRAPQTHPDGGLKDPTMDLVCVALAVGFFALSWGLVVLCERL